MIRVQRTVLWTSAVCVFCSIAVHILIVKAPGVAQAQQPATVAAGSIPLPEDPPVGLGEERAAPAPAAQPARALVAVCVDRGLPLDNVIVDVLRETPGESVFDPRVESFGRTKTKDDGKFSVTLPPNRGKTKESGAAAMYLLYFTAPGRPVRSLIIDNDTELPKEIVIPKVSTEDVYLPMHHLVVVKPEGISVSPMLSAIRGFSKDGQPIRVSKLVDHRQEGKGLWSGNGASMGTSGRGQPESGQSMQQLVQEQIHAARKRLTDAKADEDKQAARAQLRKLLSDIFAQDMREREQTAAEIESRLAKLRKQYQDREKVKHEIIELQLKVIEQDAAGLGFPGDPSSRATPPIPSGNRANLPASSTPSDPRNPLIRSGLPSPDVPARRADKYDPIPQERTLEEARKTRPSEIAELKKRGHFIESTDGKMYSYANTNQPSGPSHIRVVDSATGKLITAADVSSVAGPLEFTDEGVASREADGVLQLRVPLKRRTGPEGAVYEVPSSTAQAPFDPKQAGLEPDFLKKYSTEPQTRVGQLSASGHIVGSQDGKFYAYVETSGEGIPEGTAEIRVCDARTGQWLAAARIKAPVGKLKFFNEGVATEDADGTLKLRISFSADHDTQDVLETTHANKANPGTSQRAPTATAGSHADFTSEYNELRNQYRKTKATLALAEAQFNSILAEAQKQQPTAKVDDVKKQHPTAWQAVEQARPDFEAAHRLLETKLELLGLDRKSATIALDTAKSKLEQLSELYRKNAATMSEVNQQRTAVNAAEVNIERVERLINLFKSISAEPTPASEALPTGARGRAGPSLEDATSSNASVPAGQRIPALARSAGVSVREMLAFKPEGAAIDYDQPGDTEIAACRVVLEPGNAWTLLDRDLVLLRRFVDTNHDSVVDLWAYYKSGKEVWRDVDTNFDGKADHHEGVDSGRK